MFGTNWGHFLKKKRKGKKKSNWKQGGHISGAVSNFLKLGCYILKHSMLLSLSRNFICSLCSAFIFIYLFHVIFSVMLALFQQTRKKYEKKKKATDKERRTARQERKQREAKEERKTENKKSKRKRVNKGGEQRLMRKQGRHSANKQKCVFTGTGLSSLENTHKNKITKRKV